MPVDDADSPAEHGFVAPDYGSTIVVPIPRLPSLPTGRSTA